MSTIISLNGGLGRIITAIPSLLKYHNNNLDKKWYVSIPAWEFITWGFPELQQRTFDPDVKGTFDLFWNADEVITPEPYFIPQYYRNEISLYEAFDIAINNSKDHSDLPKMQLKLTLSEKRSAYEMLDYVKSTYKKKKTIVIQPYGSTASLHPSGIYDDTLRSIPKKMLDYFIDNLSKEYNLILMSHKDFHHEKTYKPDPDPNLREWAAIIEASDYFIGCDSCGQHMCKALDKSASVVIAGTHKKNITYDNFHIIERDVPFYPDSMRISNFHSHMSSILNEPRINFTDEEIKKSYDDIIRNIEKEHKENINETEKLKINFKKNKGVVYS